MPLPDFENAARTLRAAQPLRNKITEALILGGGWEDATERIMKDHGDQLNIDDDGNISGVDAAIASYRKANPDGFIELSPRAKNDKLPAMKRFCEAQREILKARERKTRLAGQTQRIMERVERTHANLQRRLNP